MDTGPKLPSYKWSSFALAATIVVLMTILSAWLDYSQRGRVDFFVPFVGIWLVAFLAYNWRRLRSELARGVFSAERYETNPAKYFRGPLLPYALWFAVLIVALVGGAVLFDQ
jgi:hypothetical protein